MLYVRKDIPANLLATENVVLKDLYIELNLQNTKWLLNRSYNAHKNVIKKQFTGLGEYLDLCF